MLVERLEDAEGMVRDSARNTVIDLVRYGAIHPVPPSFLPFFLRKLTSARNSTNAAKSDLKKQLTIQNVRQTIATAIISHLGPVGPIAIDSAPTNSDVLSRPQLSNSVSSISPARPPTPVAEAKLENIDPSYVNTHRELEEIFKEMPQHFEGKESEANWLKREQSCTKLRRLNAGNAPSDFLHAFLVGIKGL